MNYMKEVTKMLGVELEEEFYLKGISDKYKITKYGLFFYHKEKHEWHKTRRDLSEILTGEYKIIKKPILDEVEKRYLSNVIKPFRSKVKYIVKRCDNFNELEYIVVNYEDVVAEAVMGFPYFKKDTMYKGMELNKEYSVEDLGL